MNRKMGQAADGENESAFVPSGDGFEFPDMGSEGSEETGEEGDDLISLP